MHDDGEMRFLALLGVVILGAILTAIAMMFLGVPISCRVVGGPTP